MGNRLLQIWLGVLLAGCSQDAAVAETAAAEKVVAQTTEPTQPTPTPDLASDCVQDFADRLLAGDRQGARKLLVVPVGLSEPEISAFLAELVDGNHISRAGVGRVLAQDFGPLAERFGDAAQGVADRASLNLESAFAFGDLEAALILHWDGKRFRLAAIHQAGDLR